MGSGGGPAWGLEGGGEACLGPLPCGLHGAGMPFSLEVACVCSVKNRLEGGDGRGAEPGGVGWHPLKGSCRGSGGILVTCGTRVRTAAARQGCPGGWALWRWCGEGRPCAVPCLKHGLGPQLLHPSLELGDRGPERVSTCSWLTPPLFPPRLQLALHGELVWGKAEGRCGPVCELHGCGPCASKALAALITQLHSAQGNGTAFLVQRRVVACHPEAHS